MEVTMPAMPVSNSSAMARSASLRSSSAARLASSCAVKLLDLACVFLEDLDRARHGADLVAPSGVGDLKRVVAVGETPHYAHGVQHRAGNAVADGDAAEEEE
jgi:hypothetical protein